MPLGAVDITVVQGEDLARTWIFATPDPSGGGDRGKDVYYNFVGAALRCQIRQQQDSTSALILSLTGTSGIVFTDAAEPGGPPDPGAGAPNAIALTVTAAQSKAMTPADYYYDIFVDWANGTSTEALAGVFRVKSSVTR